MADAIKNARERKELFWIDGASHVNLYCKAEYVPLAAAKLADFFNAHLRLGVDAMALDASR